MIDRLRTLKPSLVRHRWVIVAGAALWILILLAGAVPTMKQVRQNVRDLEAANDRLASLSEWSVAGAWLGEAAERRQPALDARYARLFPVRDDREDLMLALARVARESGVEPLALRELPNHDDSTGLEEEDDQMDQDVQDLLDRFAPDRSGLPGTDLVSFRLQASFEADYLRLTRFLDGLARIDRAFSLHRLRAEPSRDVVAVEMELEVYAQRLD